MRPSWHLGAILVLLATVNTSASSLLGVTAPVLRRIVAPNYPNEAARNHWSGTVMVSAVIEADGTISDVAIKASAGNGLDEAVVKAVRKWLFSPAFRGDKAVPVRITFPVRFDAESLEVTVDLEHYLGI